MVEDSTPVRRARHFDGGRHSGRFSRWVAHIIPALLLASLTFAATVSASRAHAAPVAMQRPVRISLTPLDVDAHAGLLKDWTAYLGKPMGRPVIFIERSSRKAAELLHEESVDFAWLSS